MAKKNVPGEKKNTWKIVSIVFIALFILVLFWGAMGSRPSQAFAQPTQEQAEAAKTVVAKDLEAMGDSISNYEVFVTNRVVGFIGEPRLGNGRPAMRQIRSPSEVENFRNLQVSLRGNSTNYLYLVDIDSGKILMRSFTKWFNE